MRGRVGHEKARQLVAPGAHHPIFVFPKSHVCAQRSSKNTSLEFVARYCLANALIFICAFASLGFVHFPDRATTQREMEIGETAAN
jgi:hypothetical protein